MPECEVIGDCTLYCGDAYALLPELQADALITDPPYGTGFDFTKQRTRHATSAYTRRVYTKGQCWTHNIQGDDQPFDPSRFLHFPQIILWGAHHYATHLPTSGAWLIWDRRVGIASDDQGDADLAWTNLKGPTRIHRQVWRGLVRAGEENANHGRKLHPAQKPVALMRWCVEKTHGTVLDPFAGSCTTALACVQLGRACISVESDPSFWAIGCQRITDAYKQLDLFTPAPTARAIQEVLL